MRVVTGDSRLYAKTATCRVRPPLPRSRRRPPHWQARPRVSGSLRWQGPCLRRRFAGHHGEEADRDESFGFDRHGGGWGGRWDSNPRQPESQSGTLPAELRPPLAKSSHYTMKNPLFVSSLIFKKSRSFASLRMTGKWASRVLQQLATASRESPGTSPPRCGEARDWRAPPGESPSASRTDDTHRSPRASSRSPRAECADPGGRSTSCG